MMFASTHIIARWFIPCQNVYRRAVPPFTFIVKQAARLFRHVCIGKSPLRCRAEPDPRRARDGRSARSVRGAPQDEPAHPRAAAPRCGGASGRPDCRTRTAPGLRPSVAAADRGRGPRCEGREGPAAASGRGRAGGARPRTMPPRGTQEPDRNAEPRRPDGRTPPAPRRARGMAGARAKRRNERRKGGGGGRSRQAGPAKRGEPSRRAAPGRARTAKAQPSGEQRTGAGRTNTPTRARAGADCADRGTGAPAPETRGPEGSSPNFPRGRSISDRPRSGKGG